jgi:hypothetical protein
MTTYLIRFLSAPFIALGFIWQFVSGSFYAGRIVATRWITGHALRVVAKRTAEVEASDPNTKH